MAKIDDELRHSVLTIVRYVAANPRALENIDIDLLRHVLADPDRCREKSKELMILLEKYFDSHADKSSVLNGFTSVSFTPESNEALYILRQL